MTLRSLLAIITPNDESDRLLDCPVWISSADGHGVKITGPWLMTEYGKSGEFIGYADYCIIPWSPDKSSA